MEFLLAATLVALAAWQFKTREQRGRIALLGRHLGRYQIEKHMETLTQGYLRALGEADAQRRDQIWSLLRPAEQELCGQCARLATDFAGVAPGDSRVSRFPLYLPLAARLLPQATFDMRRALALHADAICRAVQREGESNKDRAFVVLAEVLLLQHTCHWFCRSRAVASARLLARHRTAYPQLVAAVSRETRAAYGPLVGLRAAPPA